MAWHVQINHLDNPLGYQLGIPLLTCRGEGVPAHCTILVEKEEPSGKAAAHPGAAPVRWQFQLGDLSALCIPGPGGHSPDAPRAAALNIPLAPRTRYVCRLIPEGDAPEEGSPLPDALFETGKMDEPWQAKWITAPKADRLPVFHRRIVPAPGHGAITRARLYICGLGLYEAWIDGRRVGTERLTPYCTNYHAWQQIMTHDVTALLREGGTLSVHLAEGWWAGRFGFFSHAGDQGYYGSDLRLIAEVWLHYADGTVQCIPTDSQWTVTRSTLTFSGIYDGEHRDDTLPDTPPVPALELTEDTSLLQDRLSPPVHIQETWHPLSLITTPKGEMVLDTGQNHGGIFRLQVHEPRGTLIRLQFGEVLQDGCFYRDNLRTALAEYTYLSDGAPHLLEPRFTFYGYRYVKVEGIPHLRPEDYTCMALYTDLPQTGDMTTGHPLVNQLVSNIRWGLKSNALDVPTDCPQRDERMGWTGDANVFSSTACFLQDMTAFYTKYLHDMATEQAQAEGRVPHVVPSFGAMGAFGPGESCCVWGDACIHLPFNTYMSSGDITVLQRHYPWMKAWVDYIRRMDGEDHGWRRTFHFGDWVALDHPSRREDQVLGGTEEGYIASVTYMESASILSEVARLLGNDEEAEEYARLSRQIRRDLEQEYFTPTGRCAMNTQTGLLLALKHHLGRPDCQEKLAEALQRLFQQTEGQLTTGFVGTPILLPVLCQAGMDHLAYDLLLRETYPGWLYQVKLGATTLWERWNSMNPDGTVSSTGMNSFNHYAYGAAGYWLAAYAGGLTPLSPGYRRSRIAPVMDARLSPFRLTYDSPWGTYRIGWEETPEGMMLQVTVPPHCTAEVAAPDHYYDKSGQRIPLSPFHALQEQGTEVYCLTRDSM